MRFLVVVCLSILLISVTVFSSQADAQTLCSPTPPIATHTITPPMTFGIMLINEIMSKPTPTTSLNCATQAVSGWLEIFNPQNQAYDLGSIYAAIDNGAGTTSYYLANNSAIAAHGYFVVFPPTRLLLSGPIRLLFEGIPIDQVTVPDLNAGQSYARLPDGGANWQITTTPTIGTSNNPTSNTPTIAPVPTRALHKTSISTETTPLQNGQYTPHNTTNATQPTNIPTETARGQQPAWSALHLPSEIASPQAPLTTTASPSSSIAPDSLGTPSLLPLLLGGGTLTGLTGILLIRYRKRQKTT